MSEGKAYVGMSITDLIKSQKPNAEKSLTELMTMPIPHPAFALVIEETIRAMEKHPPMHSAHEAYSVILEEVEEFWEEVKKRKEERSLLGMKEELIQIGAMACRALMDLHLFSLTAPPPNASTGASPAPASSNANAH